MLLYKISLVFLIQNNKVETDFLFNASKSYMADTTFYLATECHQDLISLITLTVIGKIS